MLLALAVLGGLWWFVGRGMLQAAEAMADATLACYERVRIGRAAATRHAPLARTRLRDALGYRPWTPSRDAQAALQATGGSGHRVALAALRLRRSSAGPLLRAITPGFVREALKARLK